MSRLLQVMAAVAGALWAPPAVADDVLSAPEALELAQGHRVTVVDVRTPLEWVQTGIPAGAAVANFRDPRGPDAFVAEVLAAVGGDRSAPVALICRSGNRSKQGVALLRERGFTQVSNVAEGMAGSGSGPGWLARGLPVQSWAGG